MADDNEVNRAVFTQILTNAGYSYKIASNGAEAVQYFQQLQAAFGLHGRFHAGFERL